MLEYARKPRTENDRIGAPERAGDATRDDVVIGEGDMTSSERVRELFNRCRRMLRQGAARIVIDLQAVTRADTKIIACLVVLHRIARGASVRLEICLSQTVMEMARICRLEALVQELQLRG